MNYFNNGAFGGFQYQQQPQQPLRWTNPLTKEQEELLKRSAPAFVLEASEEDLARAVCTHRDVQRGEITLVQNPDGTHTCTKCGDTFNLAEIGQDEVEKIIGAAIDILQTAKLTYVDMPDNAVRSLFQMIPFLKKIPKVYSIGMETMNKLNGNMNVYQQANGYGNPFGLLGALTGTPGYNMPAYGAGYQQPMGMQTPYQNAYTGYQPQQPVTPAAPMGAPMGNPWQAMPVNTPMYGYQPQGMAMEQQPQKNAVVDSTATVSEPGTVTVEKQFDI